MPPSHFDLDRVRKNWDRAREPEAADISPKFAKVRAPRDPYAAARALLDRTRSLAFAQFPERATSLAPFLDRAAQLLDRMERSARALGEAAPGGPESTAHGAGPAAPSAPAPPVEDMAPMREEFLLLLNDVEDLCEVFAGVAR